MISSSTWVPRGFASEFPEKYELDDEEMERINAMANLELNDAREQLAEAQAEEEEEDKEPETTQLKEQIEIDDDLKEYDLENYDNDETDGLQGEQVTMFPGLSNTDAKMLQDESGEGDQYLSLPTELDEQEEKKENQIYPTDNLVLATRTEDDISFLDIYIYDDGAGAPAGAEEEEEDKLDADVANGMVRESTLYVHHDIMLPAFPLCVEWVNYKPGQEEGAADNIGNFAAIGTFDPQIEIWNLDFVDKAFPDIILGEPNPNSFAAKKSKKGKKKKASQHITTHHVDAVLSLSHNKIHRSVLASTSADKTVKLWDLNTASAVCSFNTIHHNKTVSSSQWHPQEASILLTGGYDSTAAITDVRIAAGDSSTAESSKHYSVVSGEEVENVRWDASKPELFYVGTDNGNVYSFDIRQESKPLWTLHAHDAGISSLDVNSYVPGMLVTSAMGEKVVKLWKCPPQAESGKQQGPSMVLSRDFGVGNVLTTSYAPDIEVAGNMVIGGITGGLKMWDTFSNSSVRNSFKDELRALQVKAREDARKVGRASRIARKYNSNSNAEEIMTVDAGGLKDESDSESDEEVEGQNDAEMSEDEEEEEEY
ncbi:Periodic tryptophan protein 1 [Candida viswanathii]|uniref:Periodic tryptophan protein 1 n=1 Tax=Candida viswanathii TaxID=5486 RepID=A0A367XYR3_9ASCO|nr:Periodic tryptophan protein 1 [Candida viswanathii]